MAALEVKKRVTNAVLYTNNLIRIDNVRVSFPHLAEPYAGPGDDGRDSKPKFGIVGMLNKETHEAAKNLIVSVIKEMMDANDTKVAKDKWFIRDGDDTGRTEYEGHWIVSARESRQPSVRDQRGDLILDKSKIEDMIYGGCYANILIRPWYQDGQKVGKGYGKRINAGIVGVQFVRDGEPFGEGRIDDTDAWEDVSDQAGSDDAWDDDDDL